MSSGQAQALWYLKSHLVHFIFTVTFNYVVGRVVIWIIIHLSTAENHVNLWNSPNKVLYDTQKKKNNCIN